MDIRSLSLFGLVALGALVPPNASAQVPITLEKQRAEPFVMLNYNFTEYEMELEARDYWLSLKSEAPERTEYWIRDEEGEVAEHSDVSEGGDKFTAPSNGTYFLQLNGKGLVTVVFNDLITQTGKTLSSVNITVADRVAFAASRTTKTDQLCIDSEQPFDAEIWTQYGFRRADQFENVRRVRSSYDTRVGVILVFVDLPSPGWVRTAIGLEECEEVAVDDSTPTETPEDIPGTPGFIAVLSLCAPLAAASLVRGGNRRN